MSHTPGPWTIDWNGGMAPRILGIDHPGHAREIADVRFSNGSDDPQVHDNARLIAAAPDLLAALERTTERLEAWVDGERHAQIAAEERGDRHAAEGHWNTVKNYGAIIDQNRAALAKTGE